MKIIDIHSHFNIGSAFDCIESEIHKRYFDFVKKEYADFGISAGGFCPYSSVSKDVRSFEKLYEDNEYVNRLSKENDFVYQWLVLHPEREELFAQIEKHISDEKVLGIKLHPYYHNYNMEKYGDKIFSFANRLKSWVLIHPVPGRTMELVKFADKYSDMKMIIAHLGLDAFDAGTDGADRIRAILAAKNGNIYTDTSAHGVTLNNIIEYAVEKIGSEKIFFGTDTYSCGFQVGRIQYARISDKDKENILYNNAKVLFKK